MVAATSVSRRQRRGETSDRRDAPARPKHMHHRTNRKLRALDGWLMGVGTIGLAGFVERLRRRIGPTAT